MGAEAIAYSPSRADRAVFFGLVAVLGTDWC